VTVVVVIVVVGGFLRTKTRLSIQYFSTVELDDLIMRTVIETTVGSILAMGTEQTLQTKQKQNRIQLPDTFVHVFAVIDGRIEDNKTPPFVSMLTLVAGTLFQTNEMKQKKKKKSLFSN
jgi:hypothetical protein